MSSFRSPTSRAARPSRLLSLAASLPLLSCLASLLPFAAGCDRASPEVREFRGAYPTERAATGTTHEVTLTAAPAEIPLFDGRSMRVWAYNGQVPGPTLRVRLGDTVRATLVNHLPQPTTIHWHGVRVPHAMDGVPHVTQPPVNPGETFVYTFTPKDAGTFWFHPHLRSPEQIERGLFGVLVVDDAAPPAYSRDLVWVIDDWLVSDQGALVEQWVTRHDLAHDGRWGNLVTVNGTVHPTVTVRPGERLRLRLVNVANGRVFQPVLSGVDAQVIAVDGLYTSRPLDPSGFVLAPGNRLDLDVTIPATAAGQTLAVEDRFTRRPIPLATLAVQGEAIDPPRFPSPATAHVPTWAHTTGVAPRVSFALNARQGGPYGLEWTINDHVMRHDHDTAHHPSYVLPQGEWSKIRFENLSFRLHPMHIHGLFFKVLARNGTPVDEPYFRDTVLLRAKETIDVGTVPLDAGRWMSHCHILEHAESGMMTLIDVR